jgi:hypothetical protein
MKTAALISQRSTVQNLRRINQQDPLLLPPFCFESLQEASDCPKKNLVGVAGKGYFLKTFIEFDVAADDNTKEWR